MPRLNPVAVRVIRQASALGVKHRHIAEAFGISPTRVSNIVHLRAWASVPSHIPLLELAKEVRP